MTEQEKPKSDNALGLGANFTSNKVERSAELAGTTLTFKLADGQSHAFVFADGERLTWTAAQGASRKEEYEAQKVEDGLFLIAFRHHDDERTSTSVVADLNSGGIVFIRNVVGEKVDLEPTVAQTVTLGEIVGHPSSERQKFARTSELFGRRAMWVYSEDDVYEHIYLNAEWYAWHCLKGEEYPKADIDPCKMFKLRDNIYLLTFSEKVMVMGAGMVLDFGNLRSYCAALGQDPGTGELTHFTFGAFGKVLSQTDYPTPLVGPGSMPGS